MRFAFGLPDDNKKRRIHSLCNLCVLCVSVVVYTFLKITTETQRTQRLHRDEVEIGALPVFEVLLNKRKEH